MYWRMRGAQIGVMSQPPKTHFAFCNLELNFVSDADVPDWVHILAADASGTVTTVDGRGPWKLADVKAVMDRSMAGEGGKLLIDINHATDHAAPKGQPAPAVGWVVELEARADGIWGRVEWNAAGSEAVASRAYRALSPAILVRKGTNEVFAVPRLSLTNIPNLRGIAALNQQMETTMLQTIAEMLGLSAEATEEEVMAALKKALKPTENDGGEVAAEMNAALPKLAAALGLDKGSDIATILNAAETAPSDDEVKVLQGEVGKLTTQLNALTAGTAKKDAEAFVDGAIVEGRVGVNSASRDRFVKLHMNNREDTEALVNGFPKLNGTTLIPATPPKGGDVQLNAQEREICANMGVSHEEFLATQKGDPLPTAEKGA